MEAVKIFNNADSQTMKLSGILSTDETEYILSHTATAREIFEGLATSWEDCIPESEALA